MAEKHNRKFYKFHSGMIQRENQYISHLPSVTSPYPFVDGMYFPLTTIYKSCFTHYTEKIIM